MTATWVARIRERTGLLGSNDGEEPCTRVVRRHVQLKRRIGHDISQTAQYRLTPFEVLRRVRIGYARSFQVQSCIYG